MRPGARTIDIRLQPAVRSPPPPSHHRQNVSRRRRRATPRALSNTDLHRAFRRDSAGASVISLLAIACSARNATSMQINFTRELRGMERVASCGCVCLAHCASRAVCVIFYFPLNNRVSVSECLSACRRKVRVSILHRKIPPANPTTSTARAIQRIRVYAPTCARSRKKKEIKRPKRRNNTKEQRDGKRVRAKNRLVPENNGVGVARFCGDMVARLISRLC